jgi:hypothetical protein
MSLEDPTHDEYTLWYTRHFTSVFHANGELIDNNATQQHLLPPEQIKAQQAWHLLSLAETALRDCATLIKNAEAPVFGWVTDNTDIAADVTKLAETVESAFHGLEDTCLHDGIFSDYMWDSASKRYWTQDENPEEFERLANPISLS